LRKKQGKSSKLTAENSCSEVGGRRPYINFPFFFFSTASGLTSTCIEELKTVSYLTLLWVRSLICSFVDKKIKEDKQEIKASMYVAE
jgi:hypothetical protein